MKKEFKVDTPFKEKAIEKFWSYFDNSKREPGGVGKGGKKKLQIIQLDFPKWSVYYDRYDQETHSFLFSMAERRFLYNYLNYWFELDNY